ncbi:MAG: FkbM family methyltransferase [Verrucomicrobiota bacterium]|nr:FkbM family methyltransferase [Verrucomicrobiota bacterium]
MEATLRPGDVLYDIGANVGAYTLVASKLCTSSGRVYAFEPSFFNFGQLCRNILLNKSEANVVPLMLALFTRTEINKFHFQNLECGGSTHVFSRTIDYKAEEFAPAASLSTIGFSLDDFVHLPGVDPPTVIKVDVDGLEHAILQGASNLLLRPEIRSILLEVNEDLEDETTAVIELLHQKGFRAREKHQLHRRLHHYLFNRYAAHDLPPQKMSEVPVTANRCESIFKNPCEPPLLCL